MFPNDLPELISPRLRLRALTLQDAEAIYDYFSQDIVTEYYDLETFTCLQEAEHLIQIWHARFTQQTSLRWGIVLQETNKLIGTCGLHHFSMENSRAELGYELHPAYWQQGLMTEALEAVLEYGFKTFNLHRIEAFIDPANDASLGLLQKLGFESEGILRDYFFEKGRFVNAQILSKLNTSQTDDENQLLWALGREQAASPLETIRNMRAEQLHVCALKNREEWEADYGAKDK